MPTAEKAVKDRDCTQMPAAKKEEEQTGNACGKERKTKPQMLIIIIIIIIDNFCIALFSGVPKLVAANEKWLP